MSAGNTRPLILLTIYCALPTAPAPIAESGVTASYSASRLMASADCVTNHLIIFKFDRSSTSPSLSFIRSFALLSRNVVSCIVRKDPTESSLISETIAAGRVGSDCLQSLDRSRK